MFQPMIHSIFSFALLIILLSFNSPLMAANEPNFFDEAFTPENVTKAIREKGFNKVYNTINTVPELQSQLKQRISSGDANWLDLFIDLRQHPESEWGGMLDTYLAYALDKNPGQVLSVMKQYEETHHEFFVSNSLPPYPALICGYVEEDWALGCGDQQQNQNLAENARQSLQKRQQTLENFNDPKLDQIKNNCLQKVIQSKNFWSRFCNN